MDKNTDKYSFNIQWSDEDESFLATCAEFPGVAGFGETPEEALAEAHTSLELMIETYVESGQPLPEPFVARRYSGQLRLRIPVSLHEQASRLAAQERVSLNQFLMLAIQERVTSRTHIHEFSRSLANDQTMTIERAVTLVNAVLRLAEVERTAMTSRPGILTHHSFTTGDWWSASTSGGQASFLKLEHDDVVPSI